MTISATRRSPRWMARGLQCGALLSLVSGLAIAIPAAVRAEETNAAIEGRTKQSVEDTDFGGLLVVLAARFNIRPERRDEFIRLATEAVKRTRLEPGVVSYSFYEDPNQRNAFIFFEQWKSRKSLDVHLNADYTKRLLERFPDLVVGEPSTKVYRVRSVDFAF